MEIEEYGWDRIAVDGSGHDHAFSRAGGEVRTTVVTVDGGDAHVVSGLTGLVVLKTTESGFAGFPRDRFTTLAETDDRILATAVTARWRYAPSTPPDYAATHAGIRETLLAGFATGYSSALQQTLYAMGHAVLEAHPDVAEIRLSMPNRHHFLVDLEPFGLDNPDVVYHAADRPVRADRGQRAARRRPGRGRGLARDPRVLLTAAPGEVRPALPRRAGSRARSAFTRARVRSGSPIRVSATMPGSPAVCPAAIRSVAAVIRVTACRATSTGSTSPYASAARRSRRATSAGSRSR